MAWTITAFTANPSSIMFTAFTIKTIFFYIRNCTFVIFKQANPKSGMAVCISFDVSVNEGLLAGLFNTNKRSTCADERAKNTTVGFLALVTHKRKSIDQEYARLTFPEDPYHVWHSLQMPLTTQAIAGQRGSNGA